ncbi:nicotinate (nicotinamide) nucleotide adenylyltransferase [Vampirovibrio sp.]|uniref:nicotinate (nicotinamide) nucleotide adenylyltransferase n=1 Tax=Vampirovibrio sp. TaxID=2717857 RepID=UPI0035940D73
MPPDASSGHCFYFGTFNPVHSGHLMVAQSALSQFGGLLGFERITFMPAGTPPHRHEQPDLLAAALRLKLVQLATAHHPGFTVSDFELSLPDKSYTVDTLSRLAQAGLITPPVPFIIGADALAKLASWHQPDVLIDTVHFLQAPRPEYPWVEHVTLNGQKIALNTSRIHMPPLAISATTIRQQLRQTQPPADLEALRYYLPEPVRAFIGWNGLYQNPTPL